jgi:hypothetical protein
MAGIGKKVEGAVKKAAKGKATGGSKTTGGKKGKSPGDSGSGAAKAKNAARNLLK